MIGLDWSKRYTQQLILRRREKLTPAYAVGCKRVIVSDDYFPVFNRCNVSLQTGKITRITEKGIVIDGGAETEYDLIVLATGFRTVDFMHPIQITGAASRSLADIWARGAKAMYAMVVESLPNFAMLYGPNGNLGHNSIILMIESQSRYINALIAEVLRARGHGKTLTITPNAAKVAAYNEKIQAVLQKSSFADSRCGSWYKNEKGLITNNWSGTVVEYQKMLSRVNWDDYDLNGDGAQDLDTGRSTKIGRIQEETSVSYRTMGLISALSLLAVGGAVALRSWGRLRVRG